MITEVLLVMNKLNFHVCLSIRFMDKELLLFEQTAVSVLAFPHPLFDRLKILHRDLAFLKPLLVLQLVELTHFVLPLDIVLVLGLQRLDLFLVLLLAPFILFRYQHGSHFSPLFVKVTVHLPLFVSSHLMFGEEICELRFNFD